MTEPSHHHEPRNLGSAGAIRVTLPMDDPSLRDSWGRIFVPDVVKERLLNHFMLCLTIRGKNLARHAVPVSGLTLLSGPPGVGKTTLARGLAAVASEVSPDQTRGIRVVDVNLHALTSELLGRTQRNILELFETDLPALAGAGPVVVVLDEVEVLAVSRSSAGLDINPADVFRATTALLSALDTVARVAPSVFFIGTTNLPDALDAAFTSRVDLLVEVPPPTPEAIRRILADSLEELGAVYPRCAELAKSEVLEDVARLLDGLDGRRVRKLVVEALASSRATSLDPGALTADRLMAAATEQVGVLQR